MIQEDIGEYLNLYRNRFFSLMINVDLNGSLNIISLIYIERRNYFVISTFRKLRGNDFLKLC